MQCELSNLFTIVLGYQKQHQTSNIFLLEDNLKEETDVKDVDTTEATKTAESEKNEGESSDSEEESKFPDTQIKIQHFGGTK